MFAPTNFIALLGKSFEYDAPMLTRCILKHSYPDINNRIVASQSRAQWLLAACQLTLKDYNFDVDSWLPDINKTRANNFMAASF